MSHPERRPEPDKKQVALALEAARRALDGEEVRLYTDSEGRLRAVRVDKERVGLA